MFMKLDYFYFSAFDLEVKVTEILKYIRHSFADKHNGGREIYQQFL